MFERIDRINIIAEYNGFGVACLIFACCKSYEQTYRAYDNWNFHFIYNIYFEGNKIAAFANLTYYTIV